MNLSLIFKIIKQLTTKDAPEDSKRPWVFRRRFIGAAVLVGTGFLGAHYGIILDGSATDIITNNLQVIIATVSAFLTTPWDLSHIGDKLSNLEALLTALGLILGAFKQAQGWVDRQKTIPVTVSPPGQVVSPSVVQPAPFPDKVEDSGKIEDTKLSDSRG